MAKCCSFTATRDWCFRLSFSNAGLRSTTSDLGDGTVMHCWIPKARKEKKPNLLLIHGMGANAMWQWADFIRPLIARFNVYVPDLVFFGDSYTTRPERSESFQAQCVMRMMEGHGVSRMNVVGISYGGFVAYRIAEQFPAAVERLKDMEAGMFQVSSVEDAASILLPQTPEKVRELMRISFAKPINTMPTCFLNDFIDVMCTEHLQERRELIMALYKDRKLSNLPKITQPTLIIWGELDRVFPLELAHRLKRHIGENAELVIIKNAGHAINAEKPKELYKYLKSFLIDPLPPQNGKSSNSKKTD
ncbi:hypothetical protein PVL29_026584 [Vitis rotundifolia]|uniref:AB hydrolase-1 domain-containing protein n=1 Tax=Vitis rotundifolia TaxID=103349 RepID=A0AA39D4Z0_VITRO|nr:hypothetical protein PVL29_026584 [Vitis rotundifolia]